MVGCSGPEQPAHTSSLPYKQQLQTVATRRQALAQRFRRARTTASRRKCLRQAQLLLLASLDSTIWPAWYGTPWTFYGHTETPQRSSIACGYFVTTTLRDSGLKLKRVLLAQQASEVIIRNLTTEAHIQRYRGMSQPEFVRRVRMSGTGLYMVGLDNHVGFLRVKADGSVSFIHSSYVQRKGVVQEPALTSVALASQYRVVGKISADEGLLEAWLLQRPLVAHVPTSHG
ncbi:hypothetical protein KYK31_00385 [Hymenobacter norwichensis]|nr:hypothetical protein [Hymenobacter telluris]MBW3372412.1 hypothetical protein [Hymenobacter norwichensis]